MTDRIRLIAATEVDTIATTDSRAAGRVLHGPALRAIIAERLAQITRHGHTLGSDLANAQAELALAAKSYLDTYIDLELRPDAERGARDFPESWPWAQLYWKEPRPADRARALTKAIALAWAELDRLHIAREIAHAARPLGESSDA